MFADGVSPVRTILLQALPVDRLQLCTQSCQIDSTDIAGGRVTARSEFGHEISRQVSVKGIHRYLVGGGGAEPNEAVRPHEDGAAIGHTSLSRIELCACSIQNRDELTPARAETV